MVVMPPTLRSIGKEGSSSAELDLDLDHDASDVSSLADEFDEHHSDRDLDLDILDPQPKKKPRSEVERAKAR